MAEAFLSMYVFEAACTIQIRAQAGGELIPIDGGIIAGARQAAALVTQGLGSGIAWPALRRRLDRQLPGYDR